MNMKFKTVAARELRRLKEYGLNLILFSMLTGAFVGVVVTFYNICASFAEDTAAALYGAVKSSPAFIPLLFLGVAAGAVVIGTLTRFVPMIRGSGIPQAEGAARGLLSFKWYTVMCSMFAASLACIFCGLSAGAEGPSVEIGACAGGATGSVFRRPAAVKRLQTAAGSSAGFAVAFNAPLTGMVFALEEAFRSLSPQVFISAATAVITGLTVRNALRSAMGLSVGYFLGGYSFTQMDLSGLGYTALAALIAALVAVAFYYAMFACRKLFSKMTFLKGAGKFLVPFLLAGCFGLITEYSIGGGHSFISALASDGGGVSVLGLDHLPSVAIITILRLTAMVAVMACGVPCGVFVPMLAVGAGIGALCSALFANIGFDPAYSDYLVIICMAAFFTAFVRAPLTGICMVFELTGQFENFLPALLGIVIGYVVSELCRLQPGYERLLSQFIESEKLNKNMRKVSVTALVLPGSQADGGKVRKIIWPANGLVTEVVKADGSVEVPDGATILSAGEKIVFECETDSEDKLREDLYEIVGDPAAEEEGNYD